MAAGAPALLARLGLCGALLLLVRGVRPSSDREAYDLAVQEASFKALGSIAEEMIGWSGPLAPASAIAEESPAQAASLVVLPSSSFIDSGVVASRRAHRREPDEQRLEEEEESGKGALAEMRASCLVPQELPAGLSSNLTLLKLRRCVTNIKAYIVQTKKLQQESFDANVAHRKQVDTIVSHLRHLESFVNTMKAFSADNEKVKEDFMRLSQHTLEKIKSELYGPGPLPKPEPQRAPLAEAKKPGLEPRPSQEQEAKPGPEDTT